MIILYDWRVLKYKPLELILYNFDYCLKHNKMFIKQETKDSFLLNIESVLENKLQATDNELYIYIDLASRRNFFNYRYYNDKSLPTYYIEKYDITKLKNNRLLKFDNDSLYFKYEM